MANHLTNAGRGRDWDQPRSVTGMLTFLALAGVVAALYFGREASSHLRWRYC